MNNIVKEIRKQLKLSQEKFASLLGTKALTINRWETNKSVPSALAINQILNLIDKYEIDISSFLINNHQLSNDNKSLILYHGSKSGISFPIKPNSRTECDFGSGFYLSDNALQALTLVCNEKSPVFYTFSVNLSNLKILNLDLNITWALLISFYRGYMNIIKDSDIYKKYSNLCNEYDVVSGYIADDRMYKVMKNFFDGQITDIALISSLSSLDLGKQYVCKNQSTCDKLIMIKEEKLSTLELALLKKQSISNRDAAIKQLDDILIKYRRVGKYFDEIINGNQYE